MGLALLVVAGAEAGFRLAGAAPLPPLPPTSAAVEVERPAPDGHRSTYRERILVGHPFRTNRHGFRDWLWADGGGEGTLRVAVLGDSFTSGYGVAEDETWVRVLHGELLAGLPAGTSLRTLNLGKGGLDTVGELDVLREWALPADPDLVVLGYTVRNDAEIPLAYERVRREVEDAQRRPLHRAAEWLRERSAAANWLVQRLRREGKRAALTAYIEEAYADGAEGWSRSRAALVEMAETCREAGVPLLVVLLPALHDDVALNDWAAGEHRAVHERILGAVDGLPGVVTLDPTSGMAPLTGRVVWVPRDRHPNALWHARMGEIVAPVALRVLLEGR